MATCQCMYVCMSVLPFHLVSFLIVDFPAMMLKVFVKSLLEFYIPQTRQLLGQFTSIHKEFLLHSPVAVHPLHCAVLYTS